MSKEASFQMILAPSHSSYPSLWVFPTGSHTLWKSHAFLTLSKFLTHQSGAHKNGGYFLSLSFGLFCYKAIDNWDSGLEGKQKEAKEEDLSVFL